MAAADLVIRGGRVYTVDETRPSADAVAVTGDRITWVGEERDAGDHIGSATRVIDARGATVLPGFVDAHNHVRLGSDPGAVQLSGATSLEQIRARIEGFLDANADATWVVGEGWNYAAIPGGSPTADMLEGATRGLPAFLYSYDVHTVWLDREAMARLGVGRGAATALPWGTIELGDDGEPTGYVHDFAVLGISEDGERALARAGIPGYAPAAAYDRMVRSLDMATAFGITTIVEPQNGLHDLATFARARDEGTLRSRLIAAMLCLPGTTAERLDALEDARATYADDRFRAGPIKLYIDDVIEPHTAAMLEPYANAPTSGETFWDPAEFSSFLLELERPRVPGIHPRHGRPWYPDRARRGATVPRCAGAERCPPPDRARRVRTSRRHRPLREARGGRVHAAAPLRSRHRRRLAGQRRPCTRALRVAFPVDRGCRRNAGVLVGLERGRDGSDDVAVHGDDAGRPRG